MDSRKKKQPSEYPLFAVRLSEAQKDELIELVEEVRKNLNKTIDGETDRMWMKNEVVYQALLIGLPILKKNGPLKEKNK